MRVELIDYDKNMREKIYIAGKRCVTNKSVTEINDEYTDEKFAKLLQTVYNSGHWSVFRHVNFTFHISDVPIDIEKQLLRHTFFNFSIMSMRYVDITEDKFNPVLVDKSSKKMYMDNYNKAKEEASLELARRQLPIGTTTNILLTANLEALIYFFSVRSCTLAQHDIRKIALSFKNIISDIDPYIGKMFKIKCIRAGYCQETSPKAQQCPIRNLLGSPFVLKLVD